MVSSSVQGGVHWDNTPPCPMLEHEAEGEEGEGHLLNCQNSLHILLLMLPGNGGGCGMLRGVGGAMGTNISSDISLHS